MSQPSPTWEAAISSKGVHLSGAIVRFSCAPLLSFRKEDDTHLEAVATPARLADMFIATMNTVIPVAPPTVPVAL